MFSIILLLIYLSPLIHHPTGQDPDINSLMRLVESKLDHYQKLEDISEGRHIDTEARDNKPSGNVNKAITKQEVDEELAEIQCILATLHHSEIFRSTEQIIQVQLVQ